MSLQTLSLDALATVTGGRLFNTPEERARGAGLIRTNKDREIDMWQEIQRTGNAELDRQFQNTEFLGGRFPELRRR